MRGTSLAVHSRRCLRAIAFAAAALLLLASPVQGGVLAATWTAPTTNADATPLTDLAAYRVYFGTANPPCPTASFWEVSSATAAPAPGTVVNFTLTGLVTGTVYFVQVTAVDTSGNESDCSAEAVAVARADPGTAPDTIAPGISITSPTTGPAYTASGPTLTLKGKAWDLVGLTQITWVNDRGGTGTISVFGGKPGTKVSWTAMGIVLWPGTNVLTVTARDEAGNVATRVLTVTSTYVPPPDTIAPTLAITSPTTEVAYSMGTSPLMLKGTASDDVAVVQVMWTNDRGGTGTATGTTRWTAGGIVLQPGTNVITVTARDGAGNTSLSRTLTVTYTPASPPGAASPVSATGTTTRRTYSWNAGPRATWHYVLVVDSAGSQSGQWYKASSARCPTGVGLCTITSRTRQAPGPARLWVLTWNPDGYGPWSGELAFTIP